MDDHVDEAVLEHELGGLEAVGQLDFDRLGNGARAGETDDGPRLGDDHVAQHGEARGDAAGGRVGQDGDEQALGLGETRQGGGGLGHLTEGDDALVHPGPAGTDDDDQGQRLFHGLVHGDAELLADDRPHGAHEEVRLHDAENDAPALDKGLADEHGLLHAGLLLVGLDPLLVRRAAILEAQRVVTGQIGKALLERALVRNLLDAESRPRSGNGSCTRGRRSGSSRPRCCRACARNWGTSSRAPRASPCAAGARNRSS